MSEDRRRRLHEFGFTWEPHQAKWEEGLRCLKRYRDRFGHCRVPQDYNENGFPLGRWTGKQRARKERLSSGQRGRLDDLGFIWDELAASWEEGVDHLKVYKDREGNCRVPKEWKEGSFKLGEWVGVQRQNKRNMPAERRHRLEALGFVWNALADQWEEGLRRLEHYKDRVGHCRVPHGYKENGFGLGQWVLAQRQKTKTPSEERRRRLDELGFVWDPLKSDWEQEFDCLKRYEEREGHCRVPRDYKEGDYPLGNWVRTQRRKKARLSEERRRRLDKIGFIWKAP